MSSGVPEGKIPYPIKKGTEAKQAVEGFAKTSKVKAFVCGTAKMLDEKAKASFNNLKTAVKEKPAEIKKEIKDFSEYMTDDTNKKQALTGCIAVGVGFVASEAVLIVGAALYCDSILNLVRDKPCLFERLENAPKNMKNFVNEAMKKGGR